MRDFLRTILAVVSFGILVSGGFLLAQSTPVKNIVLVHGAFADGSSWSKVIPLLQAKGFHVRSVGIPLTSFADDVAATKRAIAAEGGPVILVGHSYGGLVITEAGNDPKVAGLVYVAAFAPDADQTITEISKPFPPPLGLSKLTPLSDGFLLLSPEGIETAFAQDLTNEEKALLVASNRRRRAPSSVQNPRRQLGTVNHRGTSWRATTI
jgi:pimeloyl-ACP methyl ester carboxylesterase